MGLISSLESNINIGASLTNITNIVNQYVVSPIATFGLAGFVFDAEGEAIANLSADITDHYTEDNTAVQDQIALHPEKITLKGYVGELVYSNPGTSPTTLQTLAQKLTSVSAFLPSLSAAAIQAQQALVNPASITFNNALSTTSNIYSLVQNILSATGNMQNQQNAYNYFKALYQSKTLMSIQTPWEFLTNMAIETITAIQPENSKYITDFAVTFKQMRIAQTSTTAFSAGGIGGVVAPGGPIQQGDAALQAQPTSQLGPTPGATTSIIPATIAGGF